MSYNHGVVRQTQAVEITEELPPDKRGRAARRVLACARDADDARLLLAALGLDAEEACR